jgi:RNA polymerase sigma-70 factor (ECF subfamily)
VNGRVEGAAIGPATDRSIVDRARLGDLDAFDSIVRNRMAAVYRLSLAILGNEADARDATQEAFVAAWRQIGRLRDSERFDAWLQRITVNAARMSLRGRRRRQVREISSAEVVARAGGDDRTDSQRLATALRTLSLDQRAILALHHLEGRTVAQIAGILAVPEGTVKSRLFTARRALDAALGSDDAE